MNRDATDSLVVAAQKFEPQNARAHYNLGNALRDLDRPQEALAVYELALREAPEDANNYCRRGNAQFDLGLIKRQICDDQLARHDKWPEFDANVQ